MDYLKEAFLRVKKEIDDLRNDISKLNFELNKTREEMINICEVVKTLAYENHPTYRENVPTEDSFYPTKKQSLELQNPKNLGISNGNEGVPTDRQTNQQTNQQTNFTPQIEKNTINNAVAILESLNSIKKELRLKFKRLTEQEILVFSKMYEFDEEKGFSDYKTLSESLGLTQSSIRDYVGRLILKEIPIEKIKIKNKNIQLKISENLKKIAPLATILQLREL